MKKSLIALAVLGASGFAMAQSSVTLYGVADAGIGKIEMPTGNDSSDKTEFISGSLMNNGNSRIGVRGVEDLGGGLKAGFQLESGFASDTGAGTGWPGLPSSTGINFGRQSEVNLSGGFGMVRLGNFIPESYYATSDFVGMHNHETGSSSDALYQDPVWFNGLGTKNKIGYRTPSFGGLTVDASVNLHENAAGTNNKNGYDLAANYNVGDLALGAGYSQVDDDKQLGLRALYTFGQFTVGGYYQRNDETLRGTRNNFRLAGMYALGASEFHLNVGRANSWSNRSDSAATQYTLGYNYNLSKRTKVYTYYTRINNGGNARYGDVSAAGNDFSSFAVGVRHNF